MTDWRDLERELDAWRHAGRAATLWWRDDDAVEDTEPLRRLLALNAARGVPVTLAVIPLSLKTNLAAVLEAAASAVPVQHGFSHADHAPTGERKAEFAAGRTHASMRAEIADGLARLRCLPRLLQVFVPPWNRGLDFVRPVLRELGFQGASAFGPRPAEPVRPMQVNTHVDILDWRGSRGFVGQERALDKLVGHLRERRLGAGEEPTGLLTHHLDHNEGCWHFLDELFRRTHRPGVRWLDAREVFAR